LTVVVRTEPWYRRTARGALAGGVATAAMSAVQFPTAVASGRRPPPLEITHRFHLGFGRRPDPATVLVKGFVLHFAFGTACGALYATFAPRRFREITASAYAGLLYAGSYRGILPAMRLHPHSGKDDTRRQVANFVAHAVYGVTLAEMLRWTDPLDRDGVDDEAECHTPRLSA
jgi:hypothetical protein